jgi:hypothetical protein
LVGDAVGVRVPVRVAVAVVVVGVVEGVVVVVVVLVEVDVVVLVVVLVDVEVLVGLPPDELTVIVPLLSEAVIVPPDRARGPSSLAVNVMLVVPSATP